MNTFVNQLMELKRRAQLTGQQASPKDIEAAASGYFQNQAQKNLAAEELGLEGQRLELARQAQAQGQTQFAQTLAQRQNEMAAQIDAANRARKMGWLNTGVGGGLSAGLLYSMWGK